MRSAGRSGENVDATSRRQSYSIPPLPVRDTHARTPILRLDSTIVRTGISTFSEREVLPDSSTTSVSELSTDATPTRGHGEPIVLAEEVGQLQDTTPRATVDSSRSVDPSGSIISRPRPISKALSSSDIGQQPKQDKSPQAAAQPRRSDATAESIISRPRPISKSPFDDASRLTSPIGRPGSSHKTNGALSHLVKHDAKTGTELQGENLEVGDESTRNSDISCSDRSDIFVDAHEQPSGHESHERPEDETVATTVPLKITSSARSERTLRPVSISVGRPESPVDSSPCNTFATAESDMASEDDHVPLGLAEDLNTPTVEAAEPLQEPAVSSGMEATQIAASGDILAQESSNTTIEDVAPQQIADKPTQHATVLSGSRRNSSFSELLQAHRSSTFHFASFGSKKQKKGRFTIDDDDEDLQISDLGSQDNNDQTNANFVTSDVIGAALLAPVAPQGDVDSVDAAENNEPTHRQPSPKYSDEMTRTAVAHDAVPAAYTRNSVGSPLAAHPFSASSTKDNRARPISVNSSNDWSQQPRFEIPSQSQDHGNLPIHQRHPAADAYRVRAGSTGSIQRSSVTRPLDTQGDASVAPPQAVGQYGRPLSGSYGASSSSNAMPSYVRTGSANFIQPPSAAQRYPELFRQESSPRTPVYDDPPAQYYQGPASRADTLLPRHQTAEYVVAGIGPDEREGRRRSSSFLKDIGGRIRRATSRERSSSRHRHLGQSPVRHDTPDSSRSHGQYNSSNASEDASRKKSRRSSIFGNLTRTSSGNIIQDVADPRPSRSHEQAVQQHARSNPTSPLSPLGEKRRSSFFGLGTRSDISGAEVMADPRQTDSANRAMLKKPQRASTGDLLSEETARKKRFAGLTSFMQGDGKKQRAIVDSAEPSLHNSQIHYADRHHHSRQQSNGQNPAAPVDESAQARNDMRFIASSEPKRLETPNANRPDLGIKQDSFGPPPPQNPLRKSLDASRRRSLQSSDPSNIGPIKPLNLPSSMRNSDVSPPLREHQQDVYEPPHGPPPGWVESSDYDVTRGLEQHHQPGGKINQQRLSLVGRPDLQPRIPSEGGFHIATSPLVDEPHDPPAQMLQRAAERRRSLETRSNVEHGGVYRQITATRPSAETERNFPLNYGPTHDSGYGNVQPHPHLGILPDVGYGQQYQAPSSQPHMSATAGQSDAENQLYHTTQGIENDLPALPYMEADKGTSPVHGGAPLPGNNTSKITDQHRAAAALQESKSSKTRRSSIGILSGLLGKRSSRQPSEQTLEAQHAEFAGHEQQQAASNTQQHSYPESRPSEQALGQHDTHRLHSVQGQDEGSGMHRGQGNSTQRHYAKSSLDSPRYESANAERHDGYRSQHYDRRPPKQHLESTQQTTNASGGYDDPMAQDAVRNSNALSREDLLVRDSAHEQTRQQPPYQVDLRNAKADEQRGPADNDLSAQSNALLAANRAASRRKPVGKSGSVSNARRAMNVNGGSTQGARYSSTYQSPQSGSEHSHRFEEHSSVPQLPMTQQPGTRPAQVTSELDRILGRPDTVGTETSEVSQMSGEPQIPTRSLNDRHLWPEGTSAIDNQSITPPSRNATVHDEDSWTTTSRQPVTHNGDLSRPDSAAYHHHGVSNTNDDDFYDATPPKQTARLHTAPNQDHHPDSTATGILGAGAASVMATGAGLDSAAPITAGSTHPLGENGLQQTQMHVPPEEKSYAEYAYPAGENGTYIAEMNGDPTPVMSATSYPGMEWHPYGGGEWIDDY